MTMTAGKTPASRATQIPRAISNLPSKTIRADAKAFTRNHKNRLLAFPFSEKRSTNKRKKIVVKKDSSKRKEYVRAIEVLPSKKITKKLEPLLSRAYSRVVIIHRKDANSKHSALLEM